MIEWVEKGIYDAVDNSYLKRLYFGVSADQEGADLVEEYIFSFSYGENGTSRCYVQGWYGGSCQGRCQHSSCI